ncbi:BLUF domain-containing protein [Comamonas squillarum]|uniref:BLUF domain-containing protein n=1 Tax=Comamonas squillarum TaxID=2977320 RepID=A0ABY6A318_9BURK|nr:BLUF domain-containing protein [Comamonas sp. PR12]UXC20516.1 BLUF domain-containing protein [Comamonas sp. PR12]
MPTPLSFFLYSSRLAPDYPPSGVGTLVKIAREQNPSRSITGVMMFDGERFTQYIEGPAEAVAALTKNLSKDQRHTAFLPLNAGNDLQERRYGTWSMGYSDVSLDELDIDLMATIDGDAALSLFTKAVAGLDRL